MKNMNRQVLGIVSVALCAATPATAGYGQHQLFDGGDRAVAYCVAVDGSDAVFVSYLFAGEIFKITSLGGGEVDVSLFASGLDIPFGLEADADGNVYVAARTGVYRFSPQGVATALLTDGPTTPFLFGRGLRLDAAGNVYAVAANTDNAYRITPAGDVTEILSAGDGVNGPTDVAIGPDGSVFIGGQFATGLVRIRPEGSRQTLPILAAADGLEVDSAGRLYVSGGDSVRRLTPSDPDWSAIASVEVLIDENVSDASGNAFAGAGNTVMDADENVYVVAMGPPLVKSSAWRIRPDGQLDELITADGDGTNLFRYALGIAVNSQGYVYLSTEETLFAPLTPADVFRVCPDLDRDGVCDAEDNCTDLENFAQDDADADGYGNACDGDLDQNGVVGALDFSALAACLGQDLAASPGCAESDLDGDGDVDSTDLDAFQALYAGPPGPSDRDCVTSPPTNGSCP